MQLLHVAAAAGGAQHRGRGAAVAVEQLHPPQGRDDVGDDDRDRVAVAGGPHGDQVHHGGLAGTDHADDVVHLRKVKLSRAAEPAVLAAKPHADVFQTGVPALPFTPGEAILVVQSLAMPGVRALAGCLGSSTTNARTCSGVCW